MAATIIYGTDFKAKAEKEREYSRLGPDCPIMDYTPYLDMKPIPFEAPDTDPA